MRWEKRQLGVFINGHRRGKPRLITFPILGFCALAGLQLAVLAAKGRPGAYQRMVINLNIPWYS